LIVKLYLLPQLGKPKEEDQIYMCPWVPLIPCISILSTFALCSGLPTKIWVTFAGFEVIGAIFYFSYGVRHSLVNTQYKEKEEKGEIELK